jgi:hypothetical protein
MDGKQKINTNTLENLAGRRDHLRDLAPDGRIILKLIF